MKKQIKLSFIDGIDGANGNVFKRVLNSMIDRRLFSCPNKTITMSDLFLILKQVSNKQDMAIDEYLNNDDKF